jgi:hypothetical protein
MIDRPQESRALAAARSTLIAVEELVAAAGPPASQSEAHGDPGR